MTLFVLCYLAFAALTLSLVVYTMTRIDRDNVHVSDLIGWGFASLFPIINVLVLIYVTYVIFVHWDRLGPLYLNPVVFKRKDK